MAGANGLKNPDNAGAASVDYLRMFGLVTVGYLWARMAKAAQAKLAGAKGAEARSMKAKLVTAGSGWSACCRRPRALSERVKAGEHDGIAGRAVLVKFIL